MRDRSLPACIQKAEKHMENFDFFKKFRIGTYYLQDNARDEIHVKELAECGIDVVFEMDQDIQALELFSKYGVKAVVGGVLPGWFGGDGANAGSLHKTYSEKDYQEKARSVAEHPAVVGVSIGDEPSALDLPYFGRIVELIKPQLPEKLLYLNLYPSYGMLAESGEIQAEKELGTPIYAEYLRSYCESLRLPYLSFDHYVYSSSQAAFLNDLNDAASCCREHGRRLWVVLQVNSKDQGVYLSENQLRHQAFCALAHGASMITWACYSAGWWYHHVLDANGDKTEQYQKLKNVNREVRVFGTECEGYCWIRSELTCSGASSSIGPFEKLCSQNGALLGVFEGSDGGEGVMCVPLDPEDGDNVIRLQYRGSKPLFCLTHRGKKRIVPSVSQECRITLKGNESCFFFTEAD